MVRGYQLNTNEKNEEEKKNEKKKNVGEYSQLTQLRNTLLLIKMQVRTVQLVSASNECIHASQCKFMLS